MDLGYRAEDILWLVEHGLLTLGYQSSSYLTDRVPELGIVDLPFLFAEHAGGARGDGRRARRRARAQDRGARRTTASSAGSRTASGTSPTACARCTARRPGGHCASACCRARCRRAPSNCWARSPMPHGPDRGDRDDQGRHHRRAGEPALQHGDLRRAQVPPLPHAEQPLLHLAADLPASHGVRRLAGRSAARDAKRRDGAVGFQRELHVQEEEDARQSDRGAGLRDRRAHGRASTTPSPPRCSRCSTRRAGPSGGSCSH